MLRQYLERLSARLDGPLAADSAVTLFDHIHAEVLGDAIIDAEKRQREDSEAYGDDVAAVRAILAQRETVLRESIAELLPPWWVDLAINEVILPADTSEVLRIELHYRGRLPQNTGQLMASNDPGRLDKWRLPSRPLAPGAFLTLPVQRPLHGPTWVALTAPGESGAVIVDLLTIPAGVIEPALGRIPDGHGRRRLLPAATPSAPNAWQDEVSVAVQLNNDLPQPTELILADLSLTSEWRSELQAEIQLSVLGEGGVWFAPDPVLYEPLPPLAASETWQGRLRLRIPWMIDRGRNDLVFAIVDSADGRRIGEARAAIFVDDGIYLPLSINELCADNETLLADEAGEFDDWAEIHNASDTVIVLAGHYLSDDPERDPKKWAFPAGASLEPGEHRIVWLDGDLAQGPFHADLKLDRNGEELAIVRAWGDSTAILDHLVFGYQEEDWSFGRYPDGRTSLESFDVPTPEASNSDPVLEP